MPIGSNFGLLWHLQFFFVSGFWHIADRNMVYTVNLYWTTDFGVGDALKASHAHSITCVCSDMVEHIEPSAQQQGENVLH